MDRTNDDTTLTWYYVYSICTLCNTYGLLFLLFRSSGEICDLCITKTKLPLGNKVAAAQINNAASNKLLHLTRRNPCVSYRVLHAVLYSISLETGKHACMSTLNLVSFFDFLRSFCHNICGVV
jgi:hypothetical protein